MKLQTVATEGQEAKVFSFGECRENKAAKHYFVSEGEGAAEIKEVTINGEKATFHRNKGRTIYTVLKVGDGDEAKLFYTANQDAFAEDALVDYVKPEPAPKAKKETTAKPASFDKEATYLVEGDQLSGHAVVKKYGAKKAKEMFAAGELTIVESTEGETSSPEGEAPTANEAAAEAEATA